MVSKWRNSGTNDNMRQHRELEKGGGDLRERCYAARVGCAVCVTIFHCDVGAKMTDLKSGVVHKD